MNNSSDTLKSLIDWLDTYVEENPNEEVKIESFLIWLNSKVFSGEPQINSGIDEGLMDMELSFLLASQHRHYKSYARAVLGNSELSTPEGFSFLFHLSQTDSYRKMELINMHHLEAPSGIEVLKRLLKHGFIEEYDDPDDGRAKRVCISKKGRAELERIMPKMQQVFSAMSAEMSQQEKIHVLAFLRQMEDYHTRKTLHNKD